MEQRKWSIEKSINIPNLVAVLTIMGGLIGVLIHEDSRVTTLEVNALNTDKNIERLTVLIRDNQVDTQAILTRIEERQLSRK